MPLPLLLQLKAEQEIRLWAAEVGWRLEPTGRMQDQTRILSAESLYRRMQEKYPAEMAGYNLDDIKESVFADGDYFNNHWFADNSPPGVYDNGDNNGS